MTITTEMLDYIKEMARTVFTAEMRLTETQAALEAAEQACKKERALWVDRAAQLIDMTVARDTLRECLDARTVQAGQLQERLEEVRRVLDSGDVPWNDKEAARVEELLKSRGRAFAELDTIKEELSGAVENARIEASCEARSRFALLLQPADGESAEDAAERVMRERDEALAKIKDLNEARAWGDRYLRERDEARRERGAGGDLEGRGRARRGARQAREARGRLRRGDAVSDLKLYTVTISDEIVVLAKSKEDAEYAALHLIPGARGGLDAVAQPMGHMPANWDWTAQPFAAKRDRAQAPDRTIGEWIKLGAAPEYTALRERLAKAKAEPAKEEP